MIYNLTCDYCGKPIKKYALHNHNFCSRQCLADFSNKRKNPTGYANLKDYTNMSNHMTELNEELNPTRMTDEVKEKIRRSRCSPGNGRTYSRYYGRHTHRVVAERIIGRALLPGEIVHHRDGNKRNNDPDNLVVFPSQASHAKHHNELRWFLREIEKMEGGDAE